MNIKLKFLGKLVTYYGMVAAVGGIALSDMFVLIIGMVSITLGCVVHEYNET